MPFLIPSENPDDNQQGEDFDITPTNFGHAQNPQTTQNTEDFTTYGFPDPDAEEHWEADMYTETVEEENETFPSPETFTSQKDTQKNAPFDVEHVDPLVFQQTHDNPELRASAYLVGKNTEVLPRPKKPELHQENNVPQWVPPVKDDENSHKKTTKKKIQHVLSYIPLILLTAIPILIIIFSILYFQQTLNP